MRPFSIAPEGGEGGMVVDVDSAIGEDALQIDASDGAIDAQPDVLSDVEVDAGNDSDVLEDASDAAEDAEIGIDSYSPDTECLQTGLRIRFTSAAGGLVVQANVSQTGHVADLVSVCTSEDDLDPRNAVFECCVEYETVVGERAILIDFVYANTSHNCSAGGCGDNMQYDVWMNTMLIPRESFDRVSCGLESCEIVRVHLP